MRNVDIYDIHDTEKLTVDFPKKYDGIHFVIKYLGKTLKDVLIGSKELTINEQFLVFNDWLLEEAEPITPYEGRWLYYILEPLYDELIKNDIPTYIEKRKTSAGDEYLEIKLPNADTLTTWYISSLNDKLTFKNMMLTTDYELKDLKLDRFKEEK